MKIDDKHFKNLPFLDYIFGYHAYPDRCESLSDKQKKITEIDKLRKQHWYCLEVMNEWPESLSQNIVSGTFKTIHRNTGAAIRTVPLCLTCWIHRKKGRNCGGVWSTFVFQSFLCWIHRKKPLISKI